MGLDCGYGKGGHLIVIKENIWFEINRILFIA